jgi:transcriptional regulator of acetoin/glycerol metabolism
MQALLAHDWPGNVRELVHVAEYLAATVVDDQIELEDLPTELVGARPVVAADPTPPTSQRKLADELADVERRRMVESLAANNGVKTRAALALGMPIRTFNMKVKQYGIG